MPSAMKKLTTTHQALRGKRKAPFMECHDLLEEPEADLLLDPEQMKERARADANAAFDKFSHELQGR
jgi:hypothetical protein